MDLASILLIACVFFFALRGFRAGLIKACGRILSLIAGYGASLWLTPTAGPLLSESLAPYLALSPMAALLSAALLLFVGASLVVSLIIHLLLTFIPARIPDSWPFKLGGAGVGAMAGLVIAVVLMWFLSLLKGATDDGQPVPSHGPMAWLQQLTQPPTGSLAQTLVQKTSETVADNVSAQMDSEDMIAKAVATLMLNPGDTVASLKRLSRSEDLQSLLSSRENQRALMLGDTDAIRALPDYQKLVNNEDMQRVFDPSEASEEQLATTFSTLYQRSQAMQRDPEIQALLQDPELQQQLASNNTMALLANPKSMTLMRALLQSPSDTPDPFIEGTDSMTEDFGFDEETHQRGATQPSTTATLASSQKDNTVNTETVPSANTPTREYHRWVDAQGRVHFGDQPQP